MGNTFDPELSATLTGILGAEFMKQPEPGIVPPAAPKTDGHAAITAREGNVLRVAFGK